MKEPILQPENPVEFAEEQLKWQADIEAQADSVRTKSKNLRQRLVEAMRNLPEIQKNGVNKFHGYRYIRAEDINAAVREVLATAGIAFLPEELEITDYEPVATKGEGTMNVCRVKMQYTFFDTETDEKFVTTSTGEGMDNGDKTIQKAKTVALKDLLKQMFLVASEEDDAEHQTDDATVPVNRESARGEAADLKRQACVNCGVIGSIIVDKFNGGWVCWKKAKTPGCGHPYPVGYDFKTGHVTAPVSDGNAPSSPPPAAGGTSSAPTAPKPSPAPLRAKNAIPPATEAQIAELKAAMLAKSYPEEDLDFIIADYFAEKKVEVSGLAGLNSGQVTHMLAQLKGKS